MWQTLGTDIGGSERKNEKESDGSAEKDSGRKVRPTCFTATS